MYLTSSINFRDFQYSTTVATLRAIRQQAEGGKIYTQSLSGGRLREHHQTTAVVGNAGLGSHYSHQKQIESPEFSHYSYSEICDEH